VPAQLQYLSAAKALEQDLHNGALDRRWSPAERG